MLFFCFTFTPLSDATLISSTLFVTRDIVNLQLRLSTAGEGEERGGRIAIPYQFGKRESVQPKTMFSMKPDECERRKVS
jgi:hypothetical protein